MQLTFYFAPNSTAEITRAVLAELELPHKVVPTPIGPEGTQSAAFRAINPNGRVPTIVHDGVAIWEAAAITLYLGETFGVPKGLFPEAGPARGEAMKWVVWGSATLAEACGRLSLTLDPGQGGGVQAESQDAGLTADATRARQDVATAISVLEGALANTPFLLGTYSLADTHVHGLVTWLKFMGFDLSPYPATAQWLERCTARPAIARLDAAS